MAFKIFLDANILLDFTLKKTACIDCKKIIELAVNGQVQAYITPSIVHIVGYWLTKTYGADKAKELLLSLLSDIHVVDISHQTTVAALHSKISDIEDALQYYTALHHKLNYFISLDKKFQKAAIATLPIYTPQEFLQEIV